MKKIKQILNKVTFHTKNAALHIGLFLILIAMIATNFYVFGSLSPKIAQASTPQMSIAFDGQEGTLYVDPATGGGITGTDFQVQVCFIDSMDSNGWGPACATSPWASQINNGGSWTDQNQGWNSYSTTNTGNWSTWNWPGHSDEMGSATISIVATRPLPSGQVLSNIQIGLELAEDNSGGLVPTQNNLPIDSCIQVFTPIGGGYSGQAWSYTYGDNCNKSPAQTPDAFRFYLNDTIGSRTASVSSNLPAQVMISSNTNGAFTVTNTGNSPFTASGWSFSAQGYPAGTGTCDKDTDGDGIKDAPNTNYTWDGNYPPNSYTCTITGTATANDIILSHSGSFTANPNPIHYQIANITKTTTFTPAHKITYDNSSCVTTALNTQEHSNWLQKLLTFIPVAKATPVILPGRSFCYPIIRFEPATNIISYSKSLEFNANTTWNPNVVVTAPSTAQCSNETWTLTDSNTSSLGPIAGNNPYTINMCTQSGTLKINIKSDSSQGVPWYVFGTTPFSGSTSAQEAVQSGTYTLEDSSKNQPTPTNHYGFYGFKINDQVNGSTQQSGSLLLAKLISRAEASSSNCSSISSCYLSAPDAITWNLNQTHCNVVVNAYVNGDGQNSQAVSYSLSAPATGQNFSGNTSGNQRMIDDIANATNINLTSYSYPSTIQVNLNGNPYTAVLDTQANDPNSEYGQTGILGTPSQYCSADQAPTDKPAVTFNIEYITPPVLQIK